MTTLLNASRVTKTYRRLTALADVSFSVRAGERLGLIGPNGAGKTTLFECLAGLQPMDGGSLSTGNGDPLTAALRSDLLFFLPDGIAPWPAQPLRWAIDFMVGFFGGAANRIDHVIRQLDLSSFLDRPIGTLSKGQRKRALLAIGLLTPQPILMVDEPFDGLDLRQQRDVAAVLSECASTGRTVFLSIHQIADAGRFCDRFVLLSSGRVRGEGTLTELSSLVEPTVASATTPDLEEVFLALT